MNTGKISARYAKALFQVAKSHGTEDSVYNEMQLVAQNFAAVPALRKAMLNPQIDNADRKKLIMSAAGNDKSPVSVQFSKFVDLVIERKREAHFQTISLLYQDLYRKDKNIVIGNLTTATEVDETLVKKMKDVVVKLSNIPDNGKVEFETNIDPSIIGGFKLQVGSNLLDASVSTQIQEIRKTLIEKSES